MPRRAPAVRLSPEIARLAGVFAATSALALGLVGLSSHPARAVDHSVASSLDLLVALTNAADGDTVTFASDITLGHFLPGISTDIEIHGAGYTLDAAGTYAGLQFTAGEAAVVGLTIQNTINHGVTVSDGSLTLQDVTVTGASFGGVLIENDDGVAHEVVVTDSHFWGNSDHGLSCSLAQGATIEVTQTLLLQNGEDGFWCQTLSGSEVRLSDVEASNNAGSGFFLNAGAGVSVVERVTATDNGTIGIEARFYDTQATIAVATSTDNGNHGFSFDAGTGAVVDASDLTARTNVASGVEVDVSTAGVLTLTRLLSEANDGVGIEAGGRSDGVLQIDDSSSVDNGIGLLIELDPVETADFIVERSTLAGNSLALEAELGGDAFLELTNTTVSGTGLAPLPAMLVEGEPTATFELRHSTVTANAPGETLRITGPQSLISHSVLGGNDSSGVGDLTLTGAALVVEYSLIEHLLDPAAQTVVGAGPGNVVGVDPLLAPLADNGGPTLTHVAQLGSPILDAGDPAITNPPATDQRHESRIIGSAIDLGAVEQPPALPPTGADLGPFLAVVAASLVGLGAVALLAGRTSSRTRSRAR